MILTGEKNEIFRPRQRRFSTRIFADAVLWENVKKKN